MSEFEDGAGTPGARRVAAGPRALAVDLARALRFSTRLPVPALPWEDDPHAAPDFDGAAAMFPVAGALIGAAGGLALAGGLLLGFGPLLSAALAVTVLVAITGALHEDGLADVADGFWGGSTRERRLEIMRDSRVGSFGAAALVLALILRVAAIAAIASRAGPLAGFAAIAVVGAVSRAASLLPMAVLEPARRSGLGFGAGRPGRRALAIMWVSAVVIGLVIGWPAGLPVAGLALGLALAAGAAFVMSRLARRLIGGHTGDVGGAAQQVAEVAAYLGLLIAMRP